MASLRNLAISLFRISGLRNMAGALRHYGWTAGAALTLIGA